MQHLLIVNGETYIYELPQTIQIGRAKSCDIQLKGEEISRKHAYIVFREEYACIGDGDPTNVNKSSKNGFLINGKHYGANKKIFLNSRDQIRIGNTLITYLSKPRNEKDTDETLTSETFE